MLVAVLPGALLGFAVPAGPARWLVWVAAPALTMGLTALAMGWLPVLGLPNSAMWVLSAEFVVAVGAVAVRLVLARRASSLSWRRPRLPRPADLVAVALPSGLALVLGQLLLGRVSAPPGWDAMNHALLTRNIMTTGSTAITSACTTGSTHPAVACTYYPLATNVSWAQAATLSGGHVSTAMAAWVTIIGPVFLVLAVFSAVRVLGARPVVAGCSAAATILVGPVWDSTLSGRVPEAAAPALSVGVALLSALAITDRRRALSFGPLAGIGFAGLAMMHTYDVLFAATLGAAFIVARRSWWQRRRSWLALLAILAAGAVVTAPFGHALLGAAGVRPPGPPDFPGQLGKAFSYWLFDPRRYLLLGYPPPLGGTAQLHIVTVQVGLALMLLCWLASPLCLFFGELRWARPWFVVWAVWTAIGIWTGVTSAQPARLLSSLWYNVPSRITTMIMPVYGVVTIAGACSVVLLARRAAAAVRRRDARATRTRALPVAVAALVVVLAVLAVAPSTWRPMQRDIARRTPVGPSYPRVFAWLAAHTPKGSVVAYDRHLEMMTWSYADYDVPLLFGIPPLVAKNDPDYADRFHAWSWLVNNVGAKPAGCLVRKYGVVYVVVGQARMPGIHADYSRTRLVASPRLTLVHSDGALRVYAVNSAGSACSSASAG